MNLNATILQLKLTIAKLMLQILQLQTQKRGGEQKLLRKWAGAIQVYEGYYPFSRSYRNKNPGNLKFTLYTQSLGAIKADTAGFCIFSTYEAGFEALCQFLKDAASGELKAYHSPGVKPSDFNLFQFFSVYAPASNKNNPDAYASFVAKQLGVDPQTKIATLL